ncbi:hypothetical protein VIBNIMADA3021_950010 [Vibrio nigripulchritudo MADA3021]|nr:hypothetical protein VIBNIMADA3021_950010 [Vibrio nigripulchritudo MADA3021]
MIQLVPIMANLIIRNSMKSHKTEGIVTESTDCSTNYLQL